ncbi:MAG: eukaryotic translation initiation factor 3, subunit 7 [Monoraphidium minutum]|nr:MAG: eukaryotic translation initiation factor 3, subunit 7 [Monoraphidium minutum]
MAGLPFAVPEISDNADGWGPSSESIPPHLKDVPFAPFSKTDKLGKAADWTNTGYQKYSGRQAPVATVFTFFQNEEEDSFHVVDNRPVKTSKFQQRRVQQQRFQQQRREREQRDGERKKTTERGGPQQRRGGFDFRRGQERQIQYTSSVDVKAEWAVKEQIAFSSLAKLSCSVGEPTDLGDYGSVEFYDKAFDKLTARQEKPLERTQRSFRSVTASDDPILRKLAADGAGRVFVTDTALSALMTAKSSVYSWDVVLTRVGDKLFIDKRDGGPLDLLSVNETAPEQIPEDRDNMNGVQQLSLEATAVNQSLSQQLLLKDGNRHELGAANPFAGDEGEELASAGYRYRKWALGPGLDIVVRCEVNAALVTPKGEVQLASVKALNEWNLKETDWRKKLDQSRASMLLTEAKNNKAKVARWTVEALLCGAEALKWGYVSRAGPRDNSNHVVLNVQTSKPRDFAGQIQLSMEHCWGTTRALVDMILGMDEGKYLLMKDPNKELLRLYAVPADAFDANYADE